MEDKVARALWRITHPYYKRHANSRTRKNAKKMRIFNDLAHLECALLSTVPVNAKAHPESSDADQFNLRSLLHEPLFSITSGGQSQSALLSDTAWRRRPMRYQRYRGAPTPPRLQTPSKTPPQLLSPL